MNPVLNWKRTLWILWFANFAVMAGMSLVVPFLPLYIATLGIHSLPQLEQWSGWVFSAQFATSVIFQPIWGSFADRHGRKVMLLRAGFGMGIVTALMGLVGAVWQLLVLRLFNGIFSGFISMAVSLLASVTPDKEAGKALGMLQTGGIAGSLVGPLLGGVLAEAVGYRAVFFLTGVFLITASLIVLFFVKERPVPANRVKETRKAASFMALWPLFPVFLASIVTQMGTMSIEPIVTVYVKTIYTGPHLALIAGLAVALTGFANLAGAPTLGRLGDRFGQRAILVIALLMAALTYLPQALAHGIVTLLVGRFLLGLFIGGMIPSLNVLVKKMAPRHLQATAFGINSSSLFLGNLIGPLIGSTVAAAYNIRMVFYVTMSILVANALLIIFNRRLAPAMVNQHEYVSES